MKEKIKNKEKIVMPKTKKEKMQLKHTKLIVISLFLLAVFIGLFAFSQKESKSIKINKKKTTTSIVNNGKLSVYDETSKMRPYAIMIPNDSVAKKRHYGLQKAYIIYEITVEGGITRLMAVFKDISAEKIGPTRSSRHYFLDYALENDAIYVHFGWSPQAQSDIETLGINNLNGIYNPSNMFWRDKQYSSPNNAFTSTDNIRKAAKDKKYRTDSDNYKLLNYSKEVDLTKDSTNTQAKNITINYANNCYVKYEYDETNQYYLRYNNDNKDIDLSTNEQMHIKNIIVAKMDTTSIDGDEKGRQNLNNIGSGEGYYITNGNAIKITWNKESRNAKTIYKNMNGEEIKVSDGNTFIQIEPTNRETKIE